MEVKGIKFQGNSPRNDFQFFNFPRYNPNRFDPDINLIKQGDGYRYATKSEQKRKRDKIKKQKQEISNSRRQGVLGTFDKLVGQQILKRFDPDVPDTCNKPKKGKLTLEKLFNIQMTKLNILKPLEQSRSSRNIAESKGNNISSKTL